MKRGYPAPNKVIIFILFMLFTISKDNYGQFGISINYGITSVQYLDWKDKRIDNGQIYTLTGLYTFRSKLQPSLTLQYIDNPDKLSLKLNSSNAHLHSISFGLRNYFIEKSYFGGEFGFFTKNYSQKKNYIPGITLICGLDFLLWKGLFFDINIRGGTLFNDKQMPIIYGVNFGFLYQFGGVGTSNAGRTVQPFPGISKPEKENDLVKDKSINRDETIKGIVLKMPEPAKKETKKKWTLPSKEFTKPSYSPESNRILSEIIDYLKVNPSYRIEIHGYTDDVGSADYNINVSQITSDAVKNYFISKGIDSSRLISIGFGENNPIADNKTVTGRDTNSRIEIFMLTE